MSEANDVFYRVGTTSILILWFRFCHVMKIIENDNEKISYHSNCIVFVISYRIPQEYEHLILMCFHSSSEIKIKKSNLIQPPSDVFY